MQVIELALSFQSSCTFQFSCTVVLLPTASTSTVAFRQSSKSHKVQYPGCNTLCQSRPSTASCNYVECCCHEPTPVSGYSCWARQRVPVLGDARSSSLVCRSLWSLLPMLSCSSCVPRMDAQRKSLLPAQTPAPGRTCTPRPCETPPTSQFCCVPCRRYQA